MAKRVNIVIDHGSNFSTTFELVDDYDEPLDITGYTARGQIRKHYSSNNYVDFTCTLSAGELNISLDYVQTADIVPERYVYDVELMDTVANNVTRIVEGFVTVTPRATKV